MSDVEVPGATALSPLPPLSSRLRGAAHPGPSLSRWPDRRQLLSGALLIGDVLGGGLAIVVAIVLADAAGLHIDGQLFLPMSLLLLVGTSCLLGLYWSFR